MLSLVTIRIRNQAQAAPLFWSMLESEIPTGLAQTLTNDREAHVRTLIACEVNASKKIQFQMHVACGWGWHKLFMSPRGSVVKPKIVPATVQYVTDINVKSCHRFMVLAGSKIHASGMNFRCITLQAVMEWHSHLPYNRPSSQSHILADTGQIWEHEVLDKNIRSVFQHITAAFT